MLAPLWARCSTSLPSPVAAVALHRDLQPVSDFAFSDIDYWILEGEQRIRIRSAAQGTGDASVVRRYEAVVGDVYTVEALARMANVTQTNLGDFRVRLKLSSHDMSGAQEYECGTLANSGQPVDGTRTGVSPFVDLLVESPTSTPMTATCPIVDLQQSTGSVHISFRARRDPNSLSSANAVGTAVLSQMAFFRDV